MSRFVRIAAMVIVPLTLSLIFLNLTAVDPDSEWYVLGADGQSAAVIKPFSSRILYPAAVRLLKKVSGLPTGDSFLVLGLVTAASFLAVNCLMLGRSAAGLAALPWLCLPAVVEMLRQYFLPDLPHAAELAVFFFLLSKRCLAASLATLFVAQLTRDSTLLLAVVAAGIFWRDSKRAMAVAILVTCALGIAVVAIATSGGPGNEHGLGTIQYLALKVPFNLARNVFGVELWSNTLAGHPMFSVGLPRWLHLGAIRRVGFASFVPIFPLKTFQFALTAFGFAPAVVATELRLRSRKRTPNCDSLPLWLVVALYYGVAAFLVAPCLGAAVSRLFCYAWPAFVLAAPAILWRRLATMNIGVGASPEFRFFVAAHFLVPWLQWTVNLLAPFDWRVVLASVLIGVVLQFWALGRLARFNLPGPSNEPPTTTEPMATATTPPSWAATPAPPG